MVDKDLDKEFELSQWQLKNEHLSSFSYIVHHKNRGITIQDRMIASNTQMIQDLFYAHYDDFFGVNVFTDPSVDDDIRPKSYNDKKLIKKAVKKIFQNISKADPGLKSLRSQISNLILDPDTVIVLCGHYRALPDMVKIYYNIMNDKFVVVSSKSNEILQVGRASKLEYVELFTDGTIYKHYISKFEPTNKPDSESSYILVDIAPIYKFSIIESLDNSEILAEAKRLFKESRSNLDIGIPQTYDPDKGWWYNYQ